MHVPPKSLKGRWRGRSWPRDLRGTAQGLCLDFHNAHWAQWPQSKRHKLPDATLSPFEGPNSPEQIRTDSMCSFVQANTSSMRNHIDDPTPKQQRRRVWGHTPTKQREGLAIFASVRLGGTNVHSKTCRRWQYTHLKNTRPFTASCTDN